MSLILLLAALLLAAPAHAQQASASAIEMEIARVQLQHVQRAFADEAQQQLRAQAAAYEARLKTVMEWLAAAQAKEAK